jgi:hypothetical protein
LVSDRLRLRFEHIRRRQQLVNFVTKCEVKAAASSETAFVVEWTDALDASFALEVDDRPATHSLLRLLSFKPSAQR